MDLSRRGLLGLGALLPLTRDNGTMTMPPRPRGLGHRDKLGVQDGSAAMGGTNVNPFLPGTGWDVVFSPTDLGIPPDGEIEIYHIYLDGPVGASTAVLIDNQRWDFVSQGWQNGWDPQQPLLMRGGVSLAFCWSAAFTNPPYSATGTATTQPTVTLWLRIPQTQTMVL